MANTQAQYGFSHYGYLPGGAVDMQLSRYQIQSTYSTGIYFGDPVVKSAAAGGGVAPYIIPATGTGSITALTGIFQGCSFTPKGGVPQWSPWYPPQSQGADTTAYVIDAPNALFKVAALLTAVPPSAIGEGIGFSTGAGGTTVGGGFSTYVVDQSTLTTGPVAPFQIVSMWPGVGNGSDTTTNYNWIVVTFNNQRYRAAQTTIA